jgi:hypothetical protein
MKGGHGLLYEKRNGRTLPPLAARHTLVRRRRAGRRGRYTNAFGCACTNSPRTRIATDLDTLATELLALPKEVRARLLAKLLRKV